MKNKIIAQILENMGQLLEIKGENIFKIKAYYKAADNIASMAEDIEVLCQENRLREIPGVGQAIEEKIKEFLDCGHMHAYDDLVKEIPEGLLEMVYVPSIGPKKAKLFYDTLQVKNIDELVQSIEAGRLKGIRSIKEKTVKNILKGIKLVKEGQSRMDIGTASEIADEFVSTLKKMPEVKQIAVAGSLRRMRETIRDIDILVDSSNPQKIMETFVNLPSVRSINAQGETKSSVMTKDRVQVDLRVVDPKSFGAALLYFTGSKNFNIKLRQIAIKKEMKVSEYGIFSVKGDKEKFLGGKTEEETLKILGLPYIPPELREDIGEAELFSGKIFPKLIELKDIKGDIHVHSTWSDGHNTIAEMVEAAKAQGYEYLAISDHSARLKIAGGVSIENLKLKKKEIDALNAKLKNFRVLFGTEVEIDLDGNLDYNESVLSEFDIVVASVHSGFEQSCEKLTQRLIKVCQNKHVDVIGHPTGRHIGKREPCEIDFKELCKVAVDTNTYLEINAFPNRLDLDSANVYFTRNCGVKFSINTDAHSVDHLPFMKFGVGVARRGWLEAKDVLNTLSVAQLLKSIKR